MRSTWQNRHAVFSLERNASCRDPRKPPPQKSGYRPSGFQAGPAGTWRYPRAGYQNDRICLHFRALIDLLSEKGKGRLQRTSPSIECSCLFRLPQGHRDQPQDGQIGHPHERKSLSPHSGHCSPWLLFGMKGSMSGDFSVALDDFFNFVSSCPKFID